MAHGPAVKFLSRFESEFWRESKQAPQALWDRLGSVWEATDKQHSEGGFCLAVFSGGTYVLPDTDTYADRMAVIYGKYKERVKDKKLVNWPEEPWIKTGYSIPARGQVCTVGRNLAAPYQNRLYFAGEQASLRYYGHMEAALETGHRAAAQIAVAIAR